MQRLFILLIFSSVIFFTSCINKDLGQETVRNNHAFYFWKTNLQTSDSEVALFDTLDLSYAYIRFFDVSWDPLKKEAHPVGELYYYDNKFNKSIIPCVYIQNEVMLKAKHEQLTELAVKISAEIDETLNNLIENTISNVYRDDYYKKYIDKDYTDFQVYSDSIFSERIKNYKEIQIDCDWTPKSKDNYFYFLNELKKQNKEKLISVTLRLWQYKNSKLAGIPPVDKSMLMCYSTASPKNYYTENSISTYEDVKKYIQGVDYDMPLDIALPLYSWGVLFREREFISLIDNSFIKEMPFDSSKYKKLADNRYMLLIDTVIGNQYIRYGDELRIDGVSGGDIRKIIDLLKKETDIKHSRLAFFSWDTTYFNQYGIHEIQNFYKSFN